jgi:hypothetical protein
LSKKKNEIEGKEGIHQTRLIKGPSLASASSAKARAGALQDFTKWAIENNQNSNMISLFSLTSNPILNKLWHLHLEG